MRPTTDPILPIAPHPPRPSPIHPSHHPSRHLSHHPYHHPPPSHPPLMRSPATHTADVRRGEGEGEVRVGVRVGVSSAAPREKFNPPPAPHLHLKCISHAFHLHLTYIPPASRVYLGCISVASNLYLACISRVPRLRYDPLQRACTEAPPTALASTPHWSIHVTTLNFSRNSSTAEMPIGPASQSASTRTSAASWHVGAQNLRCCSCNGPTINSQHGHASPALELIETGWWCIMLDE